MPLIHYNRPIHVLVAVKGHLFDRTAFDTLFSEMDDVAATVVDHPAAARLMNPRGMEGFDALVLYDMPGLDFGATSERPAYVDPGDEVRAGLRALLEAGKGVVALHHAIAGWPAWPEYAEFLGGSFLYRPGALRGVRKPDSGYRHDSRYSALNVAPDHPVMQGIPASFPLTDELYLYEVFEDEVTPLLRSDYAFQEENFYSALAAMSGRRNDNEGWSHPPGSNLIGWAKRALRSPLGYLQPGDGPNVYADPVVRRLVHNAIHWVISDEASAWARGEVGQ